MQPYYRIRLDDLLGRDLIVEWFEGVAIVQEVCRQILAFGSAQRGFPSPAEVFLCAHGEIELLGTASSSQSVAAAGNMLSQMLRQDAPLDLRLVATQATTGDAGYRTLQEFSGAVAHFERPDLEGSILRDLYDRASAAQPRGDVPQQFVPRAKSDPTSEELQPTTSEELQPAKKWHRNRLVLAGIAAGILCVAVLGLPRGSNGPAASVVAAVQDVVRSTLAHVAPAEPVNNDDVKPENQVVRKAPVRRAIRRLPLGKPRNDAEDRTGRSVSTLPVAAMPALLPVRPLPMTPFSGPDLVDDVPPDGTEVPALYSALNSEVVPPKFVHPKLPPAPPSGFNPPAPAVLEMVIGTNGLVERVKLRSAPRNVHEFMFVSAAKAWIFEPARLGGIPVRYLHTVALTLTSGPSGGIRRPLGEPPK